MENRKTSPCSPCAPNLLHVLPSRGTIHAALVPARPKNAILALARPDQPPLCGNAENRGAKVRQDLRNLLGKLKEENEYLEVPSPLQQKNIYTNNTLPQGACVEGENKTSSPF